MQVDVSQEENVKAMADKVLARFRPGGHRGQQRRDLPPLPPWKRFPRKNGTGSWR